MELDSKTLAILVLIFVILFKFIWTLLSGFDDLFDEFWEEINWKDDEEVDDEEEDDRHQSGKK